MTRKQSSSRDGMWNEEQWSGGILPLSKSEFFYRNCVIKNNFLKVLPKDTPLKINSFCGYAAFKWTLWEKTAITPL